MNLRIPKPKQALSLITRFASEFVNRATSLITFPLMIKYLSAEAYGVNTQIQTLSSYLLTISGLGLGFYVIKELSGNIEITILSKRFRSSLLMVSIVSVALGSLFIFLPDQINQVFFKVDWASGVIRWGAGIVVFFALEQVIKDFLRARLQMVAYSTMSIIQSLLFVGGTAAILFSGGELIHIIIFTIAVKAISILVMIVYLKIIGEINILGSFISGPEQLKAVQWGLPIVASSLSVTIISTGDRAVLGSFTNATAVGIYGASYQLANVLLAIGAPFWSMLYPLMATFRNSHDLPGLSKASRRYSNGFSIIGFPVLAGLISIGPATLGAIGSSTFEIPILTFSFIILGVFISQFCSPLLYLAYLYQKPKTIFLLTTFCALLNTGLNILLIPHMGILAAAINTTITYTVMDYFLIRMVPGSGFSEHDFFDYGNLGKYILASAVMALVLNLMKPSLQMNLLNIGILILVSAIIYAASLWALYKFDISSLKKPLFS